METGWILTFEAKAAENHIQDREQRELKVIHTGMSSSLARSVSVGNVLRVTRVVPRTTPGVLARMEIAVEGDVDDIQFEVTAVHVKMSERRSAEVESVRIRGRQIQGELHETHEPDKGGDYWFTTDTGTRVHVEPGQSKASALRKKFGPGGDSKSKSSKSGGGKKASGPDSGKAGPISDSEKEALTHWASEGWKDISSADTGSGGDTERHKQFYAGIQKLPTVDATVFRGTAWSQEQIDALATGSVLDLRHASSFTMDQGMAQMYARTTQRSQQSPKVGVVLKIKAKSTRNVSAYSRYPDEKEHVLLKGTKLKVMKIGKDEFQHIMIEATEV